MRVGRREVLGASVLLPLVPLLAACAGREEQATGRLRIATGNTGAVFDRYGRALAAEVRREEPAVDARTVVTAGSRQNLEALVEGRAEVAFCLGDAASELVGDVDAPRFSALTRLYDSFLQVVTPIDSGITTVGDLAGRRIAAGQQGSGTRVTTERVLRAAGVGGAEVVAVSLADSVQGLLDGELDALAFVSGFPVPALVELGQRVRLRGLDLGGLVPDLVLRWGPQYVVGPLPASPYGLAGAVDTVSVKTYLASRTDLAAPMARRLLDVVFERQDAVAARVPDVRQPTVGAGMFTSPVPLHPASLAWFRELDERET